MTGSVPESKAGPTLSQAMGSVFRPAQSDEDFAKALTHLALALTTASAAHVIRTSERSPFASTPADADLSAEVLSWLAGLPQNDTGPADPVETDGAVAVPIALPKGALGTLVIRLRNPAPSVRALAFERLVALSHLSFNSFRHPDNQNLERLLADIQGDATPEELASRIRAFVDADSVALAWLEGDRVSRLAMSNQPKAMPRASLPEALETELLRARDPSARADNVFAATEVDDAIVLKAERPRRNAHVLPLLPLALSAAGNAGTLNRRGNRGKWLRRAAFLLLACALSLIPIPDARRVSAEVISTEARTVTAPLSGVILGVDVADGDAVTSGDSTLFRLDTDDILQELAGAQAEYSRALLERENARGARDAAALKNAELEAEALRARIDLLENRRLRATVAAPISGVVSGESLNRFVGATVRLGDPVLEVFDPEKLALRLDVPDTLLNRIEDQETGVFRPDFAPDQAYDGTVAWISPAQSARSDVTVFTGRAALPDDTSALRPGLRGVFIFERRFKPIYRVVWDAVSDWVLLKLWL